MALVPRRQEYGGELRGTAHGLPCANSSLRPRCPWWQFRVVKSAQRRICVAVSAAGASRPVLHTFYPFRIDFSIHAPRQTAQKIHGNTMEPAVNPQGNFRFSTTLLFLYQGMGILSTFPPVIEIFFGFSAILPKFRKLVMMKSRK